MMRVVSFLTVAAGLFRGALGAAECSEDDCLRAVSEVPWGTRSSDCADLLRVTVTPATRTIVQTLALTSTGTTTSTTTSTKEVTTTAEPSKRWQDQRHVLEILLRRSPIPTATSAHESSAAPPGETRRYASPCSSTGAFASACACLLNVTQVTVTAPTTTVTKTVRIRESVTELTVATILTTQSHVVFLNSSSAVFANSTTLRFSNSTASSTGNSSSVLRSSVSSSLSAVSSSHISLNSPVSSIAPDITQAKSMANATSSRALFANSTTTQKHAFTNSSATFMNSTSIQTDASTTSGSVHLDASTNILSTTGMGRFSNTSSTAVILNLTTSDAPYLNSSGSPFHATTTAAAFLNTTRSPAVLNSTRTASSYLNATSAPFLNGTGTTAGVLNATSTGRFLNTTSTPTILNATASNAPYLNSSGTSAVNATTTAAAFLNTTRTHTNLNATRIAPYLNTTSNLFSNTTGTSPAFLNATGVFPFTNTTQTPFANATRSANSTAVRFSNTTTPAATPTPTETALECGSTPFLVQVSQPEGLFDGWWLKVSGDMIIFTSSVNYSSQFTAGSPGYLCALDYLGQNGRPTIAIVESKEGLTGSALYFVDKERIIDDGPLSRQGYGVLECDADDDLDCREGDMSNWVGCGLGLDISSDPSENVVVDTWNCTRIGLNVVYD